VSEAVRAEVPAEAAHEEAYRAEHGPARRHTSPLWAAVAPHRHGDHAAIGYRQRSLPPSSRSATQT